LRAIATNLGQLEDAAAAQALLQQALRAAQAIQDDYWKADVLRAIANQAISLTDATLRQEMLKQVLQGVQRENASEVMVTLADWYGKQQDWATALHVLKSCQEAEKVRALTLVLTRLAEHHHPPLIAGAIVLDARPIDDPMPNALEVTIQSPDQDCDYYADWWEILTLDGQLVERRLIDQVHPKEEQPFTDRLEGLTLDADQEVLVRAHLHRFDQRSQQDNSGYTDQALQGSLTQGFHLVRISEQYASWLEDDEPQPAPCEE
jgi:hypothetical protein